MKGQSAASKKNGTWGLAEPVANTRDSHGRHVGRVAPMCAAELASGKGSVPSLRGALGVGPSLRGLPVPTTLRRVPRGAIALSSISANGLRMGHGHGHGN